MLEREEKKKPPYQLAQIPIFSGGHIHGLLLRNGASSHSCHQMSAARATQAPLK